LAHDDLALYLAGHGTKEGWRRLIWLCDFAQVLCKCQDIDWAQTFERAHRSHSSRSLLLAVLLASTLLDAPAPAYLTDRFRNDSAVRRLAENAKSRMLNATPPGELGRFLVTLTSHDRLRHRLWPLAMLLMTRSVGDHTALPLPKPFWRIYYLTRPFRLAQKAIQMMLHKS
jgi:hypothetical protein